MEQRALTRNEMLEWTMFCINHWKNVPGGENASVDETIAVTEELWEMYSFCLSLRWQLPPKPPSVN